ncbi:MAG: hypothetical protein ACO25B_03635 [Chitinophagaceae bacterium]
MKVSLIVLSALLGTAVASAQSEKFIKAMEPRVAQVDSNNNVDGWRDLANAFERIGEAEKTQWLPYYYAAFAQVMAGYGSMPMDGSMGDNSSISDPFVEKAAQLLDKAEALSPDNSEICCIRKMIHSLSMRGNPMSRYMTDGARASEALARAKSLDENNPRAFILEGQDKFYTPEQYGGNKEEAKKLFERANEIFMTIRPANSLVPQWGRGQVNYFLSQFK